MPDSEVVRLEIPSSPKYVAVARKALEAIAVNIPLTEQQIEDLKLAVGEACANAVKYSAPGTGSVCLWYRFRPGCLQIEIRNKSESFDGKNRDHAKPSMEGLPIGGLGLYVIEQCVDNLEIRREDGETILTMTKQLSGAA